MSLPVLTESLDSYMAEVDKFPMLTKAEERTISTFYFENRDVESAQKLVTSNLRFVVKVALEYRSYGLALKDLVQEGNLGLMTAVKKFNPYKGVRLITYAVWWIKSFIQEYILKSKGIVKRSSKALKKKLFYKNANKEALSDGNQNSAEKAIAEITTYDLSLNTPIGEGEDTTHLDLLTDTSSNQAELVADAQQRRVNKENISTALTILNDKERYIVDNRLMADDPLSLQKIGDKFDISRERVRQIEKATLKKLKKYLTRELPLKASLPQLHA